MSARPPSFTRLVLLFTVLVTAALAAGLRYGVLESDTLGGQCSASATGFLAWLCALREVAPQWLGHGLLGGLALVGGVGGFGGKRPGLAWLGVVAGTGGLVLYNFEFSAVGALLGGLALVGAACPVPREGVERPSSSGQ